MRVGLIGAGRIGRMHGHVLASLPDVEAILVSDVNAAAAAAVAADIGGTAVASAADAIDGTDAVVIATATDAHAPLLRQSIAAARPTFIEKPLAFTLEESRDLVQLVSSSSVPVQVGFQRRFDVAYAEARRQVVAGDIGTIYTIRLIAHDAAPPPEAYIP